MEEQTQISENLEAPSRWRRFFAYLLDIIINIVAFGLIMYLDIEIIFDIVDPNPVGVICITIGTIAIWFIIKLIMIIFKKTTLGNKALGIIALNNRDNPINRWQSIIRYFVFNPAFLPVILFLNAFFFFLIFNRRDCNHFGFNGSIMYHEDPLCEIEGTLGNIANRSVVIGVILLFIIIIEIFFKCPTFIDKILGIKRVYKRSK